MNSSKTSFQVPHAFVFISYGCPNKDPQTGCLRITKIYSLIALEARCPKSTGLVPRGGRILKENLFLCFSPSSWWWLAATGRPWLIDCSFVSASVFTWPFPQVSMPAFPSSYKDTSHTRSRAHVSPV